MQAVTIRCTVVFAFGFNYLFCFIYFSSMCIGILHSCMSYITGVHEAQKRALGPLELELRDACELSFGCWESNHGLLLEQQVPLITETSL